MSWRRLARSILENPPADAPMAVDVQTAASLAGRLEAAAQARLGRSLAILHVDSGSCGGCEIELRAVTGVVHAVRFAVRQQSAPCGRAAGDRPFDPKPRQRAGAGLDRDAGAETGRGGWGLRRGWRGVQGQLCGDRWCWHHAASRSADQRLSADSREDPGRTARAAGSERAQLGETQLAVTL
jgi:hypothetical protein